MELKTLPLPLTADYTNYWEFEHGIRELLTNMLDGAGHIPANYTIAIGTDWVSFKNKSPAILSHSSIAMGASNSRDEDENIGQFGEGMKMAWLLMLRHGAKVTILNGDCEKWTAAFRYSSDFRTEIIHVDIETTGEQPEQPSYDIEVRITDLSQELLDRVRDYLESTLINPQLIRGYTPTIIELSPNLQVSLDAKDQGTVFVERIPVQTMGLLPIGVLLGGDAVNLNRDRDNVGIQSHKITEGVIDGLLHHGGLHSYLKAIGEQASTAHTLTCRCSQWASYMPASDAIDFLEAMETPLVSYQEHMATEEEASKFIRTMRERVQNFYEYIVELFQLTPKTLFVDSESQAEFARLCSPGWTIVRQPSELHRLLRNALINCKSNLSKEEQAAVNLYRDEVRASMEIYPRKGIEELLKILKTPPEDGAKDERVPQATAYAEKLALLAQRWWTY